MTISAIDSGLFRQVLRRHAAAVVVVTAAGDHGPVGFTATSFTSVSLDPPLVSFSIAATGSAWSSIRCAREVVVHVLTAGQERVARIFARRGIDRFAEYSKVAAWHAGPGGVPLLDGVLAVLVCHVVNHVEAGDHVIVVATPTHATHHDDDAATPLVYHDGTYTSLDCPD